MEGASDHQFAAYALHINENLQQHNERRIYGIYLTNMGWITDKPNRYPIFLKPIPNTDNVL